MVRLFPGIEGVQTSALEDRVTAGGHIVVRPDYGCHPVWMDTGVGWRENADPAALPVDVGLARGLTEWAVDFDGTLNQVYPPDSGFADPETEDEFWARGLLLTCRLAIGLVGRYSVAYWDGRLSCLVPVLSRAGGVEVDHERLRLPEDWVDLADEPTVRQGLMEQLRHELPPGHVLAGQDLNPIARCARCDDVLFRSGDDRYAVVHLTWQPRPGTLIDWPSTQLHTDPAALLADLVDRHL